MNLFLDINALLHSDKSYLDEEINLNNLVLEWIIKQDFENIFIISIEEKISKGLLKEEIFDAKIDYLKKILAIKTKKNVYWRYCPYKQKDIILIDIIVKDNNLKRESCVFLGNSSEQEYDANGYCIKFINKNSL